MTLDEWLRDSYMAQADAARALGVVESTLSRIRRGHTTPSLQLALKIVELTKNQVTLHDLVAGGGGVSR